MDERERFEAWWHADETGPVKVENIAFLAWQAGRRTTPDREAIIEECRQAALQRSAMLPNDNDFWRGYANGRVDAAGDIARLKTAPNGEKK